MLLNPIRTNSFCIALFGDHPQLSDLSPREVAISHPIDVECAGEIYFKDPGLKWERIPEPQICLVGRSDWAVARILFLLQSANPDLDLATVGQSHADAWYLLFNVTDEERSVAELIFLVSKGHVGFAGQADSYFHASEICNELQSLMLGEPLKVAKCDVRVPGRKLAIGWTGTKFRTQRKLVRPASYDCFHRVRPANEVDRARACLVSGKRDVAAVAGKRSESRDVWEFSIREYPIIQNASERNYSKRSLRFTDIWPPPELFAEYPNWRYALDEEGRSDQDETTLKPCLNQNYIGDDVNVTAGDVYLPNDECLPALMSVRGGTFTAVVCFGRDTIWEFALPPQSNVHTILPTLTPEQRARFPLRVVSRLSRNPKNPAHTIRHIVEESGTVTDWDWEPE